MKSYFFDFFLHSQFMSPTTIVLFDLSKATKKTLVVNLTYDLKLVTKTSKKKGFLLLECSNHVDVLYFMQIEIVWLILCDMLLWLVWSMELQYGLGNQQQVVGYTEDKHIFKCVKTTM
jgi:hypothetical protein